MTVIIAYFVAHLYLIPIAVSVLSSLAVGLTPYPSAGGLAKGLSVAANLLSFLAHKDSQSTFKLPLLPAQPPNQPVNAVGIPVKP